MARGGPAAGLWRMCACIILQFSCLVSQQLRVVVRACMYLCMVCMVDGCAHEGYAARWVGTGGGDSHREEGMGRVLVAGWGITGGVGRLVCLLLVDLTDVSVAHSVAWNESL